MIQDEFTRLYTYISQRFDNIDKQLENIATKDDIRQVLGMIDALSKRMEISDDERLVMGHQLERLDRWVHELASKIDYKLSI